MTFSYSANSLDIKDRKQQRMLEILPGALSWGIILTLLLLEIFFPLTASILVLAYIFYWFLRLIYMTTFLLISYTRYRKELGTDWMEGIKALGKTNSFADDIIHLVIIPVASEPTEVVEPGIKSISESSFPPERILVVIALEERAKEDVANGVMAIQKKYKSCFLDLIVTVHPDGIKGEAMAKGANTTYAAKVAAEYFNKRTIEFENVISSCFDSDTVVTKDYFAALTNYFIKAPDRQRASFQPIPIYNNNIWDAPGITRVFEIGSSFFQLIEATNPEKLVTFSSHSMSFKALVEIGYWPVDMVSDDSAIFWKAFIHYEGEYRVVPMYTTVSMDAVVGDGVWGTLKNVYKQRRRWAWGVENFPIIMRAFLKNTKISVYDRFRLIVKLLEGQISWVTAPFILTVFGWLPSLVARHTFSHTAVYYNVPYLDGLIFNLSTISLVISITLSMFLLPSRKTKDSLKNKVVTSLSWIAIPFTIVFLSAIPALDAQTRLMLGKYMTFWVTDKKRN